MNRLSACYFCGDAFDASLDEYPVVPERLHPPTESQQTVVVCGDCQRKLDSVVEVVVDAVGESGGTTGSTDEESDAQSVGEATDDASTDGSAGNGHSPEDSSETDVDATLEGGEEVLRSVDDGEDDTEPEDADGGSDDADPLGGSDSEDTAFASSEREESEETSTTGTEDGDAGRDADDEAGAGDEDEGASLTRLEYNKVMRLLQNRELPVERQGFVNVAANAYELAPRECDRVLDVAIQNGLIGEEDGQLVEPEEDD